MRQQRRYIKERQALVQAARDEWRVNMASAAANPDPVHQRQQVRVREGGAAHWKGQGPLEGASWQGRRGGSSPCF
jgi:hypothetical protein